MYSINCVYQHQLVLHAAGDSGGGGGGGGGGCWCHFLIAGYAKRAALCTWMYRWRDTFLFNFVNRVRFYQITSLRKLSEKLSGAREEYCDTYYESRSRKEATNLKFKLWISNEWSFCTCKIYRESTMGFRIDSRGRKSKIIHHVINVRENSLPKIRRTRAFFQVHSSPINHTLLLTHAGVPAAHTFIFFRHEFYTLFSFRERARVRIFPEKPTADKRGKNEF